MPAKTLKPQTKSTNQLWIKLTPIIVFFASYFIYLLTAYPTVGSEDSGELITSAAILDIAHPPGYPLHTLIGKLFTILIPFGNIGWRVNIMSAFFGALTVAILYLFLKKLTKQTIIAVVGSLLFAFSDIFWSQSIRAEVYTLCFFFVILISYLFLIWDEKQEDKYLYWISFLYGLSYTDHFMIMGLLGPPMVIYALAKNWKLITKIKLIAGCLLLFALGLTPYIYIPLRTFLGPYNNPALTSHGGLYTWDKFNAFINRSMYGGTFDSLAIGMPKDTFAAAPWYELFFKIVIGYAQKFIWGTTNGLLIQLLEVIRQLLYLPVILIIPAVLYLKKNFKKFSVYLYACLFFFTCFQLTFIEIKWDMTTQFAHSNRPFHIASILVIIMIVIPGFAWLIEKIKTDHSGNKRLYLLPLLLIPVLALSLNFYGNNESGNYIAYDYNKNLLKSLPLNSFLLASGRDDTIFPLYYLRQIENYRPDVHVENFQFDSLPDVHYFDTVFKGTGLSGFFMDLLPYNYINLKVKNYNFVHQIGEIPNIPPADKDLSRFEIRGIRPDMDYPNSHLKAFYYIKKAIYHPEDIQTLNYYFDKVISETSKFLPGIGFVEYYKKEPGAVGTMI